MIHYFRLNMKASILHWWRCQNLSILRHLEIFGPQTWIGSKNGRGTDEGWPDWSRSARHSYQLGQYSVQSRFRKICLPVYNCQLTENVLSLDLTDWLQDNLREDFIKNFIVKCKDLSAFLGSHQYFAGDNVNNIVVSFECECKFNSTDYFCSWLTSISWCMSFSIYIPF